MASAEGIPLEELRVLAERVGLNLTDAELEALKPMYDHHARQTAILHTLDLREEEQAVTYSPNWDAPRPTEEA